MRIGVIGCGSISGIYFENLAKLDGVEVVACADLDLLRAGEVANRYGVATVPVESMLADPDVDAVLNLTVPHAHHEVNVRVLSAGKHVYCEKPLAIATKDARALLELAAENDLRVGCAPDTFLGAALQTCRELVDAGAIGRPIGGNAFMLCHGHESWHPAPQFYYEWGGGPMFDMGPYYLTALVSLMGPVKSVAGMTQTTFAQRTITSQPRKGDVIEVETPTHIVAALAFEAGAIVQITTSFDVWTSELPHIEIYGTEGTLSVPDPNGFGGPVRVRKAGSDAWEDVPHTHGHAENSRGLGLWDMAHAIREGRPHRANGELAAHIVELINAVHLSSREARHVAVDSRPERPEPL